MNDRPTGVRVLACGGTFDKRYDPITGRLVFAQSQLPDIVERVRVTVPVIVETVMQVDSLDMTDADRERIADACRASGEQSIVVVHGTDTMPETATVLAHHFADLASSRTIVLTGAMVPYAFGGSDALFNLGFAFACAQLLAPGVWIAMNGRVFRADGVRKNRDAGVFEPVPDRP